MTEENSIPQEPTADAEDLVLDPNNPQVSPKSENLKTLYVVMLSLLLFMPSCLLVLAGPVLLCVIVILFISAIAAWREISTSKGTLLSNGLAGPSLMMPILIVYAGISLMPLADKAIRMDAMYYHTREIESISEVFFEHVEKSGQFPNADTWCDVLREEDKDNEYSEFDLDEDSREHWDYVLNKDSVGLGKNIPDDMVVIFQGKEAKWNQVGGLELVKDDRLTVNISFGDGKVETYRKEHVPYLRWKFEDSGVIPKPDLTVPYSVLTSILGFVALWLLIDHRKQIRIFWLFALIMGLLSGAVGVWLGIASEEMFYKLGEPGELWAESFAGPWGFVIGVCFVLVVGKLYQRYHAERTMLGYATVIGAITGLVASSIIHGYLMITYEQPSFEYMIMGSSIGIMAGAILGWITSGIIRFYKNNPAILNTTTE